MRRLVIALLWAWLVIGSLVFLTGRCSNQRDGALAVRPSPAAALP